MTDSSVVDAPQGEATQSAAAPRLRVRPFNFFKQETVDRSHLRRLSGLFESVCHRFSSAASSEIRQSVRFETDVAEVEPQTWEQYATALPEVTYLTSAIFHQLDGCMVMHLDSTVVLELLDFYFGGDGENVPERDELTDLEREIFGAVLESIWEALPTAFAGLMEISIGSIQHFSNALRMPSIRPNDMCIVMKFTVTVNDRTSRLFEMIIPVDAIEPVINRFQEQQLAAFARGGNLDNVTNTLDRLELTPAEIRASYPPVMLTAATILNLSVGKVITLKDGVEPPPVQLVVGNSVIATASVEHDEDPMICRILSIEEGTR
jgi:flagellar motor switch protein FliM